VAYATRLRDSARRSPSVTRTTRLTCQTVRLTLDRT
jgi:hypothetical protein